MNSLFPLRYRRVLWGAAILACLVSGFVVLLTKIPVQVPKSGPGGVAQGSPFSPAAFPTGLAAQPRLVEAVSPNPGSRVPSPGYGPGAQPRLVESYGRLRLSFEINKGQTDSQVKFLSRGSGYSLFLTGNEAVLALKKPIQMANGQRQMAKGVAAFPGLWRSSAAAVRTNARTADPKTGSALQGLALLPSSEQFRDSFSPSDQARTSRGPVRTGPNLESRTPAVVRMKLVGANPEAKVTGLEELPAKSNYFIGNDPKKWSTNVPNYARVKYANVYPGVDLMYYGDQGKLEYDFLVQPGANPAQIALDLRAGLALTPARLRGQDAHATAGEIPRPRRDGAPALRLDGNGDLVVGTDGGEVVFHKPVVYQPFTSYEPRTKN